jgi:RNA polymerase sigma factor (sigma-70 family)
MTEFLHQVRRTVLVHDGAALTDGQLLACFVERREQAALAGLVRRHGPMVWGVCRRLLRHHQDAEDAFQATFLVLVRKAASVRPRERVANWLYGVACTTAHRARVANARRRSKERQVPDMPEPAAPEPAAWRDMRPLLDDELRLLPDKYRILIVLCDLEGKTRKEAAQALGCPEGTVAGRLARARALLARRLARRGLAVSGGALAVALGRHAASAAVPALVLSSTIRAVSLSAAGQAVGLIPAQVAALTEGVLRAMLLQKIKALTVFLLAAVFLAGGLFTFGTAQGGNQGARQGTETGTPAPAGATERAAPEQAPRARALRIDEVNARMLRDLGNRFDVEVIGRTKGTVSGTELYFYDSELDVAAVHAGLVKPGEKAIITVTVVKCPRSGAGSTQHGVKSLPWDAARAGDTALLLQRRPGKGDQKPPAEDPNAIRGPGGIRVAQKPQALTLDEAVKERANQTATVEFRVASATMAWTTGFGNPDPWVIQLTPTVSLKDGSAFQLCVTAKAATHLRNLGLVNEHERRPADFFRDKVLRLTGKVESWEDRDKRGTTVYRLCVFDLDHLEVVK